MTEHEKEGYKARLRSLASRLQGDMSGLRDSALRSSGGEASGGLSNAPLHLADLATDNSEQEVSLELLQNQQHVLNAIMRALNRIEVGTFGICERCGQPIPEERLAAVIHASRCVTCEAEAELDGTAAESAVE